MNFIQPFRNSVEQCRSYVSGSLTYVNNPSTLGRVWSGISHPQSHCGEVAGRTALVGLGIVSGCVAVSALANALNPHHSRPYRAFCLITGAVSGFMAYLSASIGLAGRIGHTHA